MKATFVLTALFVSLFIVSGCRSSNGSSNGDNSINAGAGQTNGTPGKSAKVIVTRGVSTSAKVSLVNSEARFVVLTFPLGRMPALNQQFNIYRRGLKVGEIKVTGPQTDDNVVADLIAGNAQVGDEVR